MSNALSPINPETHAELAELMGGDFEAMNINEEERIIAGLVASVRGQIVAAMQEDNVGVRQLSRELGVSAAAVSRHLNAEGDMRFSTAALLAHALHRHWSVNLVPDRPAVASTSNYYGSAFSQHAADLMFSANVGPTITGSTSTVGMIDRDRAIEPLGVLTY